MTFRVLTAELSHETNTFSRRVTSAQSFKDRYVLFGEEAIAARGEASTELAGFLISDGHFVGDGPILGGLHRSYGPTAVLRVAGFEILIVTIAQQMLDLQQFKSFGIEPESKQVIVLKSMQHFRAAFEPIAGRVIVCDSGALCTLDYTRMPYRNVPRPIFPLDEDVA